jgi:hypothetical protein
MKQLSKILCAAFLISLFNSACFFFGSLPLNVKNFLETADKIELIADADKKDGKIKYRGDMIKKESLKATITDERTKKKIIQSVSSDVGGNGDAVCFLPNHILRATKGNQTVDVEICYQCMRIEIKGSLGEHSGGLNFTFSESVLNQVLLEKGVEIE